MAPRNVRQPPYRLMGGGVDSPGSSLHTRFMTPAHSRRRFLSGVAMAAPALLVPSVVRAAAPVPRALSFVHTHTSEQLRVEYFTAGRYVPDAMAALNRLLRDFRTGEEYAIDPALFDLLHQLQQQTSATRPYEVISGYRSPVTNATLRQRSEGVASGSLHMTGRAIDIRLSDVPLARLRDAARALRLGGVGYYPGSNFVHVDTGRVRAW
jgi:uncharacterized protein YcbK (DUF882 family)